MDMAMNPLSTRDNNYYIKGWERDTQHLWPTLIRDSPEEAWGFSALAGTDVGQDSAHWHGVVAYRHDKGTWLRVSSVRDDTPASRAGIQPRDLVTRINGQIVFHMKVKDIERVIRDSGTTLLLDIERDTARSSLFGPGTYATPLNFLYNDLGRYSLLRCPI